jgi:hypothetical protein
VNVLVLAGQERNHLRPDRNHCGHRRDIDDRINLVDWDSDGDGLCDGWCTSDSTSAWRIGTPVEGWNVTLPPGMPNGEDTNQNGTNEQNESSPIKPDTDAYENPAG